MPVRAKTNFCRDGLSVVNTNFDNGGDLRACHPRTLWHGECTSTDHTDTCAEEFNGKTFTLAPRDALRNLSLANVQAETTFARLTTSLADSVFFASARSRSDAAGVWTMQVRLNFAGADTLCATLFKRAIQLGCVTTALVNEKWRLCTKACLADALYCEHYVAYARREKRLPWKHSPLIEHAVKQVLCACRLPRDLWPTVCAFVFY